MPSNKWTQGSPLSGATTRAVLAERCYIADADTSYSDPTDKYAGGDPSSWDDLGIIKDSQVQLAYTKEIKPVETGIEKVLRGTYSMSKKCTATFTLEQFDLATLALVTDLSVQDVKKTVLTVETTIGGKMHIGQDDVVEKALLFLGTNKVDGKEYQHYCKKASLTYNIEQADDSRVLKVDAMFYAFLPAGESVEAFFTLYVID